jgi:hypothetical protein
MSKAGAEFDVALWATFPEYGDPRLVVAASWLDQESPLVAYGQFGEILRETGFPLRRQPSLLIRRMSDPFIVDLRKRFADIPDIEGERLGGMTIGGHFLEDGYVYHVK